MDSREDYSEGTMYNIPESKEVGIETRQANNIESLLTDDRKTDAVRIVVARPKGPATRKNYMDTAFDVSKGLAGNGYAVLSEDRNEMDTKRQVMTFEMDEEDIDKTVESIINEVNKAQGAGMPHDGSIIVYVPERKGKIELYKIIETKLKDRYPQAFAQNFITVIPDNYTDLEPQRNRYPDYLGRLVLGRHINSYYKGDRRAYDRIRWQLGQLDSSGDPEKILYIEEGKLRFLRALDITPIDYEKGIKDWYRCQKEAAMSI